MIVNPLIYVDRIDVVIQVIYVMGAAATTEKPGTLG
jgi:hypothetical protein